MTTPTDPKPSVTDEKPARELPKMGRAIRVIEVRCAPNADGPWSEPRLYQWEESEPLSDWGDAYQTGSMRWDRLPWMQKRCVEYMPADRIGEVLAALSDDARAEVLAPWLKPERDERYAAIREMAKARGIAVEAQSSRDMLVWLQDDVAEERGGQFADLWTQLKAAVRRGRESESRATIAEARVAELADVLTTVMRRCNEFKCLFCGIDGLEDDGEHEAGELCTRIDEALARIAEMEKR